MAQTKEEVYDAEINPLMTQIIEICKRAEIGFITTFQLSDGELPNDNGDPLFCSTIVFGTNASDTLKHAARCIQRGFVSVPRAAAFGITITKGGPSDA